MNTRNRTTSKRTQARKPSTNRKPYVRTPYTGPVLAQHKNHALLREGQKFFIRALAHCYHEIEELLKLISKTPYAHRKALLQKKARLQREADYIIKVKLEGVQL